jgi:dephospho-CoA kinase
LLVTGLPCAGKTTLGAYLSEKCDYYHIEASDFMKRAFYERHGMNSSLSVEAFAEEALNGTPDIVVHPVLEEIERAKTDQVVVTGFRSPNEIEIFKRDYQGPTEIECWYIQAKRGTRFNRSITRGRQDAPQTIGTFRDRDLVQQGMGLGQIRLLLRKTTVVNELTIQEYLDGCARKLGVRAKEFRWPSVQELYERPTSLEEAILIGLAVTSRKSQLELSTTQIAHKLNEVFTGVIFATNKNNVSRYFNFKPHPFYNVTRDDDVLKYSLSATGRSRALGLVSSHWLP